MSSRVIGRWPACRSAVNCRRRRRRRSRGPAPRRLADLGAGPSGESGPEGGDLGGGEAEGCEPSVGYLVQAGSGVGEVGVGQARVDAAGQADQLGDGVPVHGRCGVPVVARDCPGCEGGDFAADGILYVENRPDVRGDRLGYAVEIGQMQEDLLAAGSGDGPLGEPGAEVFPDVSKPVAVPGLLDLVAGGAQGGFDGARCGLDAMLVVGEQVDVLGWPVDDPVGDEGVAPAEREPVPGRGAQRDGGDLVVQFADRHRVRPPGRRRPPAGRGGFAPTLRALAGQEQLRPDRDEFRAVQVAGQILRASGLGQDGLVDPLPRAWIAEVECAAGAGPEQPQRQFRRAGHRGTQIRQVQRDQRMPSWPGLLRRHPHSGSRCLHGLDASSGPARAASEPCPMEAGRRRMPGRGVGRYPGRSQGSHCP